MALGAAASLQEVGRTVPGDVSMMGFDDAPETAYFVPGLTTVRQNFTLLGRSGVNELLRVLDVPGSEARRVVFQPCLIERDSTAPAPFELCLQAAFSPQNAQWLANFTAPWRVSRH